MLSRALYVLLATLAAVIALLVQLARAVRNRAYRDRIGDRLGLTRLRLDKGCLWVHAASMGEVQAAAALVTSLLDLHPKRPLLMTTTTPTGAQRVRSLFKDRVHHAYLPFDVPLFVSTFLERVRPELLIILETELWPTLYRSCTRRGVPILLASARLSERSVRRYQNVRRVLPALMGETLAAPEIAAQTAIDAERFRAIGAPAERVSVAGNLKFDMEVSAATRARGVQLREQLGARFIWTAGSTHPGEETVLLDAHDSLRTSVPDALLVLVPRHPQRFEEVAGDLERRGVPFVRRSQGEMPQANHQVFLIDTMGELLHFYAAGSVGYVGGTLIPLGGHNLLEPAALGVPVLCGPHTFNSGDVAAQLRSCGALQMVDSAAALGTVLRELSSESAKRVAMGQAGADFLARNRGTRERLLARISQVLAARR